MSNAFETSYEELAAAHGEHAARMFLQGENAALTKVSSHIQGEVERMYAARVAREVPLAEFAGQVLVCAQAAELRRIKTSMLAGVCWACTQAPISPTSVTGQCDHCEASAI